MTEYPRDEYSFEVIYVVAAEDDLELAKHLPKTHCAPNWFATEERGRVEGFRDRHGNSQVGGLYATHMEGWMGGCSTPLACTRRETLVGRFNVERFERFLLDTNLQYSKMSTWPNFSPGGRGMPGLYPVVTMQEHTYGYAEKLFEKVAYVLVTPKPVLVKKSSLGPPYKIDWVSAAAAVSVKYKDRASDEPVWAMNRLQWIEETKLLSAQEKYKLTRE